jgi:hypothetical protein
MTSAQATFLEEILSYNMGVEIRDDYSGRGMYGEKTYALVVDGSHSDVINCILNSGVDLEKGLDDEETWDLRFDSMGRSSIVIY